MRNGESMSHRADSFYEDFYPRGFRKLLAVGVICLTSLVPAIVAWQREPENAPVQRFGGPGGFSGLRPGGFNKLQNTAGSRLPIGRTVLAMFGGVFGLMIYCPRWGFKRYALVCGPILGLGSILVLNWYLTGRTKVYRFEAVFAALIGTLPAVAVYILLARRKWHLKNPPATKETVETIWIK
jgi:hypothetical protein